MLFRDGLIKLCQSDDASLDHSSWSWKGGGRGACEAEGGERRRRRRRRRGASEEGGGESSEEEPDESLDWTGKCMNEHGLQTL